MEHERKITLLTPLSLEIAMRFVDVCNASKCDVFLSKDGKQVSGNGILGVVSFMLTLKKGESIVLTVKGANTEQVLDSLIIILVQTKNRHVRFSQERRKVLFSNDHPIKSSYFNKLG